jgi:hypothetical protein
MPSASSSALPIAHVVLRILIVLNILYALAIVGLLTATVVAETWTMKALGVAEGSDIQRLLNPLRAIAFLGFLAIFLNHTILRRLLAMVGTVRQGDPFVAENARNLQAIGWALMGIQLLSLVIAAIARAISTAEFPVNVDAGFSIGGWLAVLLAFVLARVFAEGARMREDLEGTV